VSKAKAPKIVLWDIETTHNLAAVFNLAHNDYINPENIVQERYIVCAAWKTLGQKAISAVATTDDPELYRQKPHSDKFVVETLHTVLSDADVIVAHNGDQYDIKFTEGRMLYHGLPPLPPILKIDTLKEARNRFLLNSNKLDYLGNYLGVGRKKPTSSGLWLRVLQADPTAVMEMVKYNKQDVALLERVFLKLRPYMAQHTNRHLFGDKTGCPRCGSLRIQSRGKHRSITQVYQRFQCQDCGGWFRDKNADVTGRIHTRILG
jgi:hypothetical protein